MIFIWQKTNRTSFHSKSYLGTFFVNELQHHEKRNMNCPPKMFETSAIPSLHFIECAQVLLLARIFFFYWAFLDEHNWYVGFQLDPGFYGISKKEVWQMVFKYFSLLHLWHTKSLYRSRAGKYFYGTENVICAGFGPAGNSEKRGPIML